MARLPIVVLIHGESYEFHSGNPYNGTVLASTGQIIVVTVNYRLGVFGFLSSGDMTCRGNWGLSDIVCALQFIKEIIESFGGDKDQMTLAGFGTGAALVNLLMSSPMSAPAQSRLFKRAILSGGSSLSSWALVPNPEEQFMSLAKALQCPTALKTSQGSPEPVPDDKILNCIREHSAENITLASQNLTRPSFLNVFGPVIDATVVITHPAYNLERHSGLFHEIDLMLGLTSNPAFHFLGNTDVNDGMDLNSRNGVFRTLSRNLYAYHRGEIYEALKNQYTDWTSSVDDKQSLRDGALNALSDALYVAPIIKTAQLHAKQTEDGKRRKSQTYLYVFTEATKGWNRGRVEGSIGGEDIPYFLGTPQIHEATQDYLLYRHAYDREESMISEDFVRFVSNFVKTGNPHSPVPHSDLKNKAFDRLSWPSFEFQKQAFLELGRNPRSSKSYRADNVAFWNRFIPNLHKHGKEIDEEHNLLPDHFNHRSYFGTTSPYGGIESVPFPPPPLPPTPIPSEVVKIMNENKKGPTEDKSSSKPPKEDPTDGMEYSTVLSVTVAVGCALLVLNILIFAGIYHQRDKQKRSKKAMQLHYQSYDTTGQGINLNSPLTAQGPRMPPAPPPPITALGSPAPSGGNLDSDSHHASHGGRGPGGGGTPSGTSMRTFHHHHHQSGPNDPSSGFMGQGRGDSGSGRSSGGGLGGDRGGFPEQEPLLSGPSSAHLPRQHGISPTCPRHGRALAAAAQSSTVEEIQV